VRSGPPFTLNLMIPRPWRCKVKFAQRRQKSHRNFDNLRWLVERVDIYYEFVISILRIRSKCF